MNDKIFIWIIAFMLNISLVFAQTGLFDSGNAGTFATTGIVIVVVILLIRELFSRFFKRK